MSRAFTIGIWSAVAALSLCATPLSATDPTVPGIPRVRANGDPAIAALLLEAPKRSATLRRLVEAIDASDGIVYLERGTCRHSVKACLAMTVVVAGSNRILRVVVDTRRGHDALLVSIGHELQHVLEALSDPHVTNNYKIHYFFDRIGATGSGRFETQAAIQAGQDVEDELRATFVGRVP
jgi:hypothetical protein